MFLRFLRKIVGSDEDRIKAELFLYPDLNEDKLKKSKAEGKDELKNKIDKLMQESNELSGQLKENARDDVAGSVADIRSLNRLRIQAEEQLSDIKQKLGVEKDPQKRKNHEGRRFSKNDLVVTWP